MTYRGERLLNCHSVPFNWRDTDVIVVSGTGPNACGHALIRAGYYYFHVDGINDYPWYMTEPGYRRYLKENGKKELDRTRVTIRNPAAVQAKLEELSAKRWRWMVFPNNCASYVEALLAAGGSRISSLTNCPTLGWR